MESKWLNFIDVSKSYPNAKKKTQTWVITTKEGYPLGKVQWYPHWRQYCFYTEHAQTIWNADCLDDVNRFIRNLMDERK